MVNLLKLICAVFLTALIVSVPVLADEHPGEGTDTSDEEIIEDDADREDSGEEGESEEEEEDSGSLSDYQ